MTILQIVPLDPADPAALYLRYPADPGPQPCVVTLDLETGELSARYNPEPGTSIPESVHHGRILWWSIPCLTASGANELLENLAPLATRVLAGAAVSWDGHNRAGQLNEDATSASAEIAGTCAAIDHIDYPHVLEWDATDWFAEGDIPEVSPLATAEDLARIADSLAADARSVSGQHSGDLTVLNGLDDWLADRQREARAQVETELADTATELAALEARRDELIRQCDHWLSLRAVGELADLSHTQARRIVNAENGPADS